ncbi:hypothetical protein SteCoe_9399 [Stentor coeruleus]|uniref:EF-hand domain-containing protein n=1 Tax=Stentor coeruleus TaxID=5963 RepID=A0A1R2CHV6_9CILI|nr:hypothetical protein SteCoe_9399 [Stentor coeruleus]
MEVFASIITYSMANWKTKVKLSFLVFDFDESKSISKDEMVIMIISFVRGIGSMTNSTLYESLDLEPLGKQCFDLANSDSQGLITLDQLTTWIGECEEIMNLLQKYEPKADVVKKHTKVLTKMPNTRYFKKEIINRRESISVNFAGRKKLEHMKNFSLPRVIEKKEWKSRDSDLQLLHDIFYKHANDRGFALVGEIYQELIESPQFKRESEFFFHEFDFNANAMIKFSQLIDFMDKSKSKQGYFLKRGSDMIFPTSEPIVKRKIYTVKIPTLKSMFKNFDKNRDGFLTYEELKDGLRKHFTKCAIKEIFENYDVDGNKLIDFAEFMNVFSPFGKGHDIWKKSKDLNLTVISYKDPKLYS